jgi:hypothetical protein
MADKCANCNQKVGKGWNFCPKCGMHIAKPSIFDKLLTRAVSQMGPFKEMNRMMGEIDPKAAKKSFSISINFGGGEPKVRIQPIGVGGVPQQGKPARQEKVPEFSRKVAGDIEEPKASVRRSGDRFTAQILLPDIDSDKDIEMRKVGESIEIRAYTKDKTYFKILKCPETAEILDRKFKDGKLMLEFA